MSKFKSTITKKTKIDFKKVLYIDNLYADTKLLEMHSAKIKQMYPNVTDEMVRNQIDKIIIKENSFNLIMEYLSSCYTLKKNKKEFDELKEKVSNNFGDQKNNYNIDEITNKFLIKSLIFEELAKEKKISVNDEQTKEYLDNYYKSTNNSVNEFMNNKEKFEEIRSIILEEKITQWLIDTFKIYMDIKIITHRNQQNSK